jgi:hypothetical protein
VTVPPHVGTGRRAKLLVGSVLLAALIVGCAPGVDAQNARTIATNFLVAGQPSGYVVVEMTTDPPQDAGGSWRVKVDAVFRDPANADPQGLPVHVLIDVDKATGQARIVAQG